MIRNLFAKHIFQAGREEIMMTFGYCILFALVIEFV